jgi:hypothetical protein
VFKILISEKKIQTPATRYAKTFRGVSATRYAKTFRGVSIVVVPRGTKVMGQRAVLKSANLGGSLLNWVSIYI